VVFKRAFGAVDRSILGRNSVYHVWIVIAIGSTYAFF
jgi:hypothetical protein